MKLDEIRSKLTEPQMRSMSIGRDLVVDEANRTVNLAFASDKPCETWFGDLILSMGKKNVRTDRLDAGLAVLMDHDRCEQVGIVESFDFGKDGIARAIVKISRSDDGEEVFQDIKDGIRRSVSVGFMVHELHLEKQNDAENDLYRSDDWEPIELSFVSIPADISVGVGRSLNLGPSAVPVPHSPVTRANSNPENNMTPEEIAAAAAAEGQRTAAPAPVVGTPAPSAAAELINRTREIVEFAEIFGQGDMARQMIAGSSAVTLDDVREAIKAKQTASVHVPVMDPATAAAREGVQVQPASIVSRHAAVTAFSGERKEEKAYRFGKWLLGRALYDGSVPACAQARDFCDKNGLTRAMSEGTNEAGGFLVPLEFGTDMIDLREKYGVFRRNAKIIPMAGDTKTEPVRTSGLTVYYPGEAGSITASDMAWGQVTLVAKKFAALARYSTEVNEDSVIDFANTLAEELAYAFSKAEDDDGFNGDGSGTYGGITGVRAKLKAVDGTIGNIKGLKVGTGNAYSELVLGDFQGTVAILPEYADTPNAKWFCSRSFYWNVMVKALLAGGGVTAMEVEEARREKFLGYPVEFSQVMPSTEGNSQVCAILGDLSLGAILATRRDVTVAFSEHSRFANDQLEIRGTQRVDINVHGVGDTSVAGPLVGLITAAS